MGKPRGQSRSMKQETKYIILDESHDYSIPKPNLSKTWILAWLVTWGIIASTCMLINYLIELFKLYNP